MNELAYIPRHFRKCVKYKNLIKFNDFKDNEKLNQACLSAYKNVQMGCESGRTHECLVFERYG